MRFTQIAALAVAGLTALAGCEQPVSTDMTFQRGVQMLAAGSPKSAIPFLTQVIASVPDGPEPHAMLSLAYALDLQADRAIAQAGQVRRPKGAAPGWECVAIAVAAMTQNRPDDAVGHLRGLVNQAPPGSPVSTAARQWLVLALILKGDHKAALEMLDGLAKPGPTRLTALLWGAIVHARQNQPEEAAKSIVQGAAEVSAAASSQDLRRGDSAADDQGLYDDAVAAVAKGDLAKGEMLFAVLQQRSPRACDAPVWLALMAARKGDWSVTSGRFKETCQVGSPRSQGLTYHLFSVICALEGRPDAMVQSMVTGQRMLGRSRQPAHVIRQPSPDKVWLSDDLK